MANRIMPREGFTADFVASILKRTVFDPVKTLTAVLLLQYGPSILKNSSISIPFLHLLPQKRDTALSWLRVAFALGVLGSVNGWLSRRTINRGVKDKYDWSREIILITGGSNGFGKEAVLMLAARIKGVKIAILDVMPPSYTLPNGSDSVDGPTVQFFHCDITSAEAIAEVAAQIRDAFGGDPTVLINNAGIIYARPLLESTGQEIDKMFNVNTFSHYKLLNEFLPSMISRNHGMVVTVASQGGNCTTPGMTAYCATKAAAIGLHEGLLSELTSRYNAPRVRTVLVTPAYGKTFITRDMIPEDSFLSPLLEPATVAEAMVNQIIKGESGYVGVSRTADWLTFTLRATPLWYQTSIRDRLARSTIPPPKKHSWVNREEE